MNKCICGFVAFASLVLMRRSCCFGEPFQILGECNPQAISADGSTVVGSMMDGPINSQGFRWTESTGLVGLGRLYNGPSVGSLSSGAADVSADGSVVVGSSVYAGDKIYSTRWTAQTGLQALEQTSLWSGASGVTADGSVAVGCISRTSNELSVAYRWNGSFQDIGRWDGTRFAMTEAEGVSGDGRVIVGNGLESVNGQWQSVALRWDAGTGLTKIASNVDIEGITSDGSTVFGEYRDHHAAFVWQAGTGLTEIPPLSGQAGHCVALGGSADGSIIVGASGNSAFIWDAQNGARDLTEVLTAQGVSLDTWAVYRAVDVSDDGRTIVGSAVGPGGATYGFIATVPEPSTCAGLSSLFLTGLLIWGWRKRKAPSPVARERRR